MRIENEDANAFASFCKQNMKYWDIDSRSKKIDSEKVILVELFDSNRDSLFRSIILAKFLQNYYGYKIVALTGTTALRRSLYEPKTENCLETFAKTFGITDFLYVDTPETDDMSVAVSTADSISDRAVGDLVDSISLSDESGDKEKILSWVTERGVNIGKYIFDTCQRCCLSPKYDLYKEKLPYFIKETAFLHNTYSNLFRTLNVAKVVTSHIDYNLWGLLGEIALQNDIDVFYQRIEGNLSVFVLKEPPKHPNSLGSISREGETFAFERFIWPYRAKLSDLSDKVVDLINSGEVLYPPWWTQQTLEDDVQHKSRMEILSRIGLADDRPVFILFSHALTDEVRFDTQPFPDCYDWLKYSLKSAAGDPTRNWILKVHPHDDLYDRSGAIADLRNEFGDAPNIRFIDDELTKTEVFEICDVGLTIRGSLGFELAAAGIPVILAGRSRMSDIGFAFIADDIPTYDSYLASSLDDLRLSEEQIYRARLYIMYNRLVSTVSSAFIPYCGIYPSIDFWREAQNRLRSNCVEIDVFYRNLVRSIELDLPRVLNCDFVQSLVPQPQREGAAAVAEHSAA